MAHVTRAQLIKNPKRSNMYMWRWLLRRHRDIRIYNPFVHDCIFLLSSTEIVDDNETFPCPNIFNPIDDSLACIEEVDARKNLNFNGNCMNILKILNGNYMNL